MTGRHSVTAGRGMTSAARAANLALSLQPRSACDSACHCEAHEDRAGRAPTRLRGRPGGGADRYGRLAREPSCSVMILRILLISSASHVFHRLAVRRSPRPLVLACDGEESLCRRYGRSRLGAMKKAHRRPTETATERRSVLTRSALNRGVLARDDCCRLYKPKEASDQGSLAPSDYWHCRYR